MAYSSAPGRVNLIGEHTDYTDGLVFPAAIDKRVSGLFAKSNSVELISKKSGKANSEDQNRGWGRYAFACLEAIKSITQTAIGIKGVIDSDLPSGAGLSSSAALEVCLIGAINQLYQLNLTHQQIAETAWRAENDFVGVKCGRMDQMASALGEKGKALLIDTRNQSVTPVQIPEEITIAILYSGVSRALAKSAYNERVKECEQAANLIGTPLRDATLNQINILPPLLKKRARHVITENQRTLEFKKALETNNHAAIKNLCQESHNSLKNDYEVSSKQLDALARSAWNAPGCIGARLTGAGFGGCCVALIQSGTEKPFFDSVKASYHVYGFPVPTLYTSTAAQGLLTNPCL